MSNEERGTKFDSLYQKFISFFISFWLFISKYDIDYIRVLLKHLTNCCLPLIESEFPLDIISKRARFVWNLHTKLPQETLLIYWNSWDIVHCIDDVFWIITRYYLFLLRCIGLWITNSTIMKRYFKRLGKTNSLIANKNQEIGVSHTLTTWCSQYWTIWERTFSIVIVYLLH